MVTQQDLDQIKHYLQDKFDKQRQETTNYGKVGIDKLFETWEHIRQNIWPIKNTLAISDDFNIKQYLENQFDIWDQYDADVKDTYLKYINIDLPQTLLDKFKLRYNMTNELATMIFIEYAKFLTLMTWYPDTIICPGFWVDQLWHAHMEDTYSYMHYVKINKGHKPSDGTAEGIEEMSIIYIETIKLYEEVFRHKPIEYIWQPGFLNDESQEQSKSLEDQYFIINLAELVRFEYLESDKELISTFREKIEEKTRK